MLVPVSAHHFHVQIAIIFFVSYPKHGWSNFIEEAIHVKVLNHSNDLILYTVYFEYLANWIFQFHVLGHEFINNDRSLIAFELIPE